MQTVCETLFKKKKKKAHHKKRVGGVAQGVGPEFKPQQCKKNRKATFQYLEILFI
jgi:hypothetical protein